MRARSRGLIGAVMLSGALLAGCSSSVESGVVVGKKYYPERDVVTQRCTFYDKNMVCRHWRPVTSTQAEQWTVTVEGVNGRGESNATDTWEVSEEVFDRVEIGQALTKGTR